jgi:hypothetical protein
MLKGLHRPFYSILLLLAPVASALSSAPGAPTPLPSAKPPAGFVLAFSDEFETPGSLDPAKWGYEIGYIRNDEKQFYTSRSENVRAEGGNLVIEARKEAYQGYGYTSGSVNTLGAASSSCTAVWRCGRSCPPGTAAGRRSGCWAPTASRSAGLPAARSM